MKNITAIILAAGESSRMYPFDNGVHKTMIKIMGKPILYYTIEALKNSGIVNLVIVTDGKSKAEDYFGNGRSFGVSIEYVIQEKPEGAGDALLLAAKHITGDFLLANASHVEADILVRDVLKAKTKDVKAVLLAKKKTNGVMQGVLRFTGSKVEEIVEKPKIGEEPSDIGVVGIYLFQKDFLETLKKTHKEHYQLEAAISSYAKKNNAVFVKTHKETVSLKYPWDLLNIKNYLFKKLKRYISSKAEIAESAELIGEVYVEDGASIMENVVVKGPCYIGKNAYVGNNAILRGGIDVGENVVVGANMEIKNSILMQDSTTHSGYMGDSIIGKNCKIAAGFITANVRLDRGSVKATVKGEKTDTGLKMLGVMMGDNSNTGIKVTVMPGITIGRNVTVGSSTTVMSNVQDDTKYYAKFQEIINKKNG